jgi:hypothetical protein
MKDLTTWPLKQISIDLYKVYGDDLSPALPLVIADRIKVATLKEATEDEINYVSKLIEVWVLKNKLINLKSKSIIRNEDKAEINFESLFDNPKNK